jgi:hypothetical protein
MRSKMMVHCGAPMEAEERGGGWVVATVCPVGIGPGLAPIALLTKCVRCPVARRRRREEAKRGDSV